MVLGKRNGRSTTRSGSAGERLTATYHTRVSEYAGTDREGGDAALSAYADLYGRVERRIFADVAAGRSATVKEQQKLGVDSLRRRIARAERQIADASERRR